MSRNVIAIAHSLSEDYTLRNTRVEVLLLGRGRGCDREFSGAACASMHRSIRRYSSKESKSTDLSQYLDGKRWKCQKLRRDLLILRSLIPQSGVECVCSYVRSFTFDCRGSKHRTVCILFAPSPCDPIRKGCLKILFGMYRASQPWLSKNRFSPFSKPNRAIGNRPSTLPSSMKSTG